MSSRSDPLDSGRSDALIVDHEEQVGLISASGADDKYDTFAETTELSQGLHERHLHMIAIAGTIGTGLFLNSGRAIATGGPLGALLGFSIIGMAVSSVVLDVGEMGALVPLNGAIVRYAEYFVDPALACAAGWNHVYACLISLPAEMTAAAVLVEFWIQVDSAIWITVFSAMTLITALSFIRVYGEVEYVCAVLKIMLIVGINLMAVIITCGIGIDQEPIGFKFWHHPGPFVQYLGIPGALGRFLGFFTVFRSAVYAYTSMEGLGVAAAETRNPHAAIPQAAKRTFIRVLIFYILTLFMVGLVVPSDDPNLIRSTGTASQSPFVIAARRAGIKVVPSVINALVLTSSWSAGNSNILHGTRYLYGLAASGHAPAFFTRVNRFGAPYAAIALHALFMGLAFTARSSSASAVFLWLQSFVAVAGLVNWIVICVTYLRFFYACRRQGIDRHAELPWASPFQPYITWMSLLVFVVLLLTGGMADLLVRPASGWNLRQLVSSYFNIPLILGLYLGNKYWSNTRVVALSDMPIRYFIDVANRDMKRARLQDREGESSWT